MIEYLENSIFLRRLKKINLWFLIIEHKINSIYLSSFTLRLIIKTIEAIKSGLKFSVFGRLTQINEDASRNFLETSNAIRMVLNVMSDLKNKLITYSATSKPVTFLRNLRCSFFFRPIKFGGIIVVTTIIMNTLLALLLHKEMSLIGIIYRLILFFLGIFGIFSEVNWEVLIANSIVLRRIRKMSAFQ